MIINKKNIAAILLSFIGILFVVLKVTKYDYLLIKVIFSVCCTLVLAFIVYYIFTTNSTECIAFFIKYKYELMLIAICLVVYSPFLIQGYFFHDDWWGYNGRLSNSTGMGINLSRAFHGLLIDMFWFVSPSKGYIIKWFSVGCVVVYGLILFRWIKQKSQRDSLSFLLTAILIFASVMSDHIGYSSTISLLPGLVMASLSVICFDLCYSSAKGIKKIKVISYVIFSILCLVCSFMFYQIATPIIFLFLSIHVYFEHGKTSSIKYSLAYISIFATSAVLYLVSNNMLNSWYGISTTSRGDIIGISQIPEKFLFFLDVLKLSLDRISAAIGGSLVIQSRDYRYIVEYRPFIFVSAIYVFFFCCMLCTLIIICRKKRWIDAILLILFLPCAYYCYLVLKENSYLTYYAIPLISLLLFYITIGLYEVTNRVFVKKFKNMGLSILISLLLVLCIQNNVYISQFWVGTHQEGYSFLKNTIATQIQSKNRIHVFGVLTPGQGNIYSVFMTNWALRELGYQPDNFQITVSENEYYIPIIQDAVLERISEQLSDDEVDYLKGFYTHDDTYGRLLWSYKQINDFDLLALQALFAKSGQLPSDYNDVIVVDLRWAYNKW